jgi:hypothetical protein
LVRHFADCLEKVVRFLLLESDHYFSITESLLDILAQILYIHGKRAFHSGSSQGATMTSINVSEKLQTLHQQASTHNALLEINRHQRQRQQLERRQAWNALKLAITTLIRLELSGNKHARV